MEFLRRITERGDDDEPIASTEELVKIPNSPPNPAPRYTSVPNVNLEEVEVENEVIAARSRDNMDRIRWALGSDHGIAVDEYSIHLVHQAYGEITIKVDHHAAIFTKDIRRAGNRDIVRLPLVDEQIGGAVQFAIHTDRVDGKKLATLVAQVRLPLPRDLPDDSVKILVIDSLEQVHALGCHQPAPGFEGSGIP